MALQAFELPLALDQLDSQLLQRLERRGFSRDLLLAWSQTLGGEPAIRNRLPGKVECVPAGTIQNFEPHAALAHLGRAAIAEGRVAACVLAGGMATRMGGVVKALVEVLPGKTFLDLRLDEVRAFAERGAPVPLWLMTSEPTDAPIAQALALAGGTELARTFEQFVSLRLEHDGELFRHEGEPSVYATGHGDLPDALRQSGLLAPFRAQGGRYVWVSNLDNLGAVVDETVLGYHIAAGRSVTAEVVDKRSGDAGGGPVLHEGRAIIAENFRLPPQFDAAQVTVFNTNSFIIDATALEDLDLAWTYLEVHKTVAGRSAVQFERLLGELTMALETNFLRVPRDGLQSRFLPVKTFEDLSAITPLLGARLTGSPLPSHPR